MGTTAEKFDYAFDTKDLLKTEINKINNVLTDESTFRSYPQELFNGYLDILNNGTDTLWNNLEKVSASGEEATLENVETAPIKMVLNGNTSQETTKGKNLFTGLIKNVRLDPNNGEEFSGSTGATTDFIPVNINSNISYYLSGLVDTIRSFTCAYNSNKEFLGRTSAQTVSEKALTVGSFTAGTPTGTGDIAYIRITQYIQGEGTIDIIDDAEIQLELGSTATSYEPYTGGQPSPSPDYPQEVKVVKGENVVSVQGKNLVDYLDVKGIGSRDGTNNITLDSSSIDGDLLTITKTYQQGGGVLKFNNISLPKIEQGEIVTISFIPNKTIRGVVGISNYNGGGTNNITTYASFVENSMFEISLEALSTYDKLGIFIQGLNQSVGIKNLMVERGSIATPYVPYSKTDYPINLGTLELCKIRDYKDYLFKRNGKWYVHKEIGKYELDENAYFTQNWNTNTDYETYCMLHTLNTNFESNAIAISNILPYVSNVYGYDKIGIYQEKNNGGRIIFRVPKTIANSVSEFKTWLASNSMIVYTLIAPTEEEITNTTLIEQLEAIYKAKSVKDKTYVTQTNDELPFILDVEAIKEYSVA